jgi:hypothetical protein
MRQWDEMVLEDDLRKVRSCKECGEDIEYFDGKAVCACKGKGSPDEKTRRKSSEETD